MARLLMIGSEGALGERLKRSFSGCMTMDVSGQPNIKADLLTYPELPDCDVIIMLACATKDPQAPFEAQQVNLRMNEFVVVEAISRGIPVVFASSVWADVHHLNAYGCVKRCTEQMVDSHGGASIRVGWVGYTQEDWDAAPELRPWAWSDDKLREAFEDAVSRVIASGDAANASAELRAGASAKLAEWRASNV